MGKLIFENLIDTTDYEANNILRANQLNTSFKQPEVATYALLKAISAYFENVDTAGADTTVDINESEGADLQTILTKAFRGINNVYASSSSVETTLSKSETYATMKINSSSPNYANSIEFNDKLTIKSNTNLSFGIEISNSNYSKISGSKVGNIGQLIYSSVKSGKSRTVNFDDVADLIKNGNLSIKNTNSVIEVNSTTIFNHTTISPLEFSIKPTTDSFAYAQMGLYMGGFVRIRPDNNGAYGHIHCIEYDDGDPDEPNYQQCVELELVSETSLNRKVTLGETGYNEGFALEIRESGSSFSQLTYNKLSFYTSATGYVELNSNDITSLHGLTNRLKNNYLYYIRISTGNISSLKNVELTFYLAVSSELTETDLIIGAPLTTQIYNQIFSAVIINQWTPCSGLVSTGTASASGFQTAGTITHIVWRNTEIQVYYSWTTNVGVGGYRQDVLTKTLSLSDLVSQGTIIFIKRAL